MPGAPLRSVPTGLDVPTGASADTPADDELHGASTSLDLTTDLDTELGLVLGPTAVVVAASLLDFLR